MNELTLGSHSYTEQEVLFCDLSPPAGGSVPLVHQFRLLAYSLVGRLSTTQLNKNHLYSLAFIVSMTNAREETIQKEERFTDQLRGFNMWSNGSIVSGSK